MASREAELLYAVKNNDLKTVISCYETGVKATEVDKDSNNILHVAAASGHVLMVRAVLMFYCLDGSLLEDKNNKGQVPASVTDNDVIRADIHKIMSGPGSGSMWESYCMQTTVATAKPWLDSPCLDMPHPTVEVQCKDITVKNFKKFKDKRKSYKWIKFVPKISPPAVLQKWQYGSLSKGKPEWASL